LHFATTGSIQLVQPAMQIVWGAPIDYVWSADGF
jgi:hypothetical protein